MRFVPQLSEFSQETLTEMHKKHPKNRARMRAHIILMSADRKTIEEIAKIYHIQRDTVSSCLTKWETKGIVGLLDKPKSGRPRLLTAAEEDRALKLIEEDQRNSKKARSRLQEELWFSLTEVMKIRTEQVFFERIMLCKKHIQKHLLKQIIAFKS